MHHHKLTITAVSCVLLALVAIWMVSHYPAADGGKDANKFLESPTESRTIAQDITFSSGAFNSTNLTVQGKIQRIERDFPKIGPFTFKLTRTILIEGVDLQVGKPPGNIKSFLRQEILKNFPDTDGFKIIIKSLNITSNLGKQSYESIEL